MISKMIATKERSDIKDWKEENGHSRIGCRVNNSDSVVERISIEKTNYKTNK